MTGVAASVPTSAVSSAEKTIGTVASTRPLADLGAVDVERRRAALAEPAAVVGELDPDLVLAGRDRLGTVDLELPEAEQVVAVRRLAVLAVDAPAAEGAALGDDRPGRTALGDHHLGR